MSTLGRIAVAGIIIVLALWLGLAASPLWFILLVLLLLLLFV